MDAKNDSAYARAPNIDDLLQVCRELNQKGVKYIIIGGIAVALHGYPRGTKDIDMLVDSSIENIKKIKDALSYLPDNAIKDMALSDVQKHNVVRVADHIVIDLMKKACQIDYKEASQHIDLFEIEGVEIPIASKEILIKMKDTVRPSDKTDVEYLKVAILEDEKNRKSKNKL